MIRRRKLRRAVGAVLIVAGGILMWAAASPVAGALLFGAAAVLELLGMWLERPGGQG